MVAVTKEQMQHCADMVPDLIKLLTETDMRVPDIAEKLSISETFIYRTCQRRGIDMRERCVRLGHRKGRKGKRKGSRAHSTTWSNLPETMTGDGLSLEWLSKRW